MRAAPRSNEWPLVFFTLLIQAAAGAAVVRVGVKFVFPKPWFGYLPYVIPALTAAGAIAAAFHLGSLLRARFALANLRSSWLSREAILCAAFGATAVAPLMMIWAEYWSLPLWGTLNLVAAILGLVLVHAISRLYRLRTVPAWDTWATPASFFTSALILGALAVAIAVGKEGIRSGPGSPPAVTRLFWLGLLTAGATAAQIVILVLHLRRLRAMGGVASRSVEAILTDGRNLLVARVSLAALGVIQILRATSASHSSYSLLALVAGAVLLFASEVLGRYLFYASHKRVGL